MAILSAPLATAHPWLHSLPPHTPGRVPEATRRWMCWSAGTEWRLATASALSRSLSCRVRELVAHRALPGRVARHGRFLEMPWLAFPASSSCRGLVSWLEYFVLEWFQRSHRGSWRLPGKRQTSGRGKTTTATRQRPRQGTCCDKRPLCAHAPAHPPMCRPGGLSRRACRRAVQPAVRSGMRSLQDHHRGERWRP